MQRLSGEDMDASVGILATTRHYAAVEVCLLLRSSSLFVNYPTRVEAGLDGHRSTSKLLSSSLAIAGRETLVLIDHLFANDRPSRSTPSDVAQLQPHYLAWPGLWSRNWEAKLFSEERASPGLIVNRTHSQLSRFWLSSQHAATSV